MILFLRAIVDRSRSDRGRGRSLAPPIQPVSQAPPAVGSFCTVLHLRQTVIIFLPRGDEWEEGGGEWGRGEGVVEGGGGEWAWPLRGQVEVKPTIKANTDTG